ncbi:MAG: amidase [Burkholderiaceae bacterium]|nr:amidase [Burkholderiaceae bacterium]
MLSTQEYVRYDGLGLAELVRNGDTTPTELSQVASALYRRLNPALNAVLQWLDTQVPPRDPAAAFYGVPFLIKELVLHAAGVRCDMGSSLTQGIVPEADTELMARFRRAGLCLTGTTQTPELGYSPTTEPRLFGPVHNPWNPEHSPGGSSGGSAAAIAAGIVPVAHGNDGGGSLRIPASCCGLVGLKPTRDRTPTGPDYADPLSGMGIEFALMRSVRDCAALLDAVAGADPGAPGELPAPPAPYAELIRRAPGRLRVAWTTRSPSGSTVEDVCVEAVHQTVRLLEDLGHTVVEDAPIYDWDLFLQATHIHWTSFVASVVEAVTPMLGRRPGPAMLEAGTLACYEHGMTLTANQLQWAFSVNNIVSRSVGAFFTRHDLLVTPTLATRPVRLGTMGQDREGISAMEWTKEVFDYAPFTPMCNMTGLPALSLPLHWSVEGLPVGVQLVGGFAREDRLLQVARELEDASPWHARQVAQMLKIQADAG